MSENAGIEPDEGVPARVMDPVKVSSMRRHLVDCATRLMIQKGYHATSVRDIARECDWPMGKVYLYVRSKQDLLYLVGEDLGRSVWDGLLALPRRESALETLLEIRDHLFRSVDEMRDKVRLMYWESGTMDGTQLRSLVVKSTAARMKIANVIEWGIAEGEFAPADSEMISYNMIFAAHMWALKVLTLRKEMTLDDYIERQTKLLLGPLKADGSGGGSTSASLVRAGQ